MCLVLSENELDLIHSYIQTTQNLYVYICRYSVIPFWCIKRIACVQKDVLFVKALWLMAFTRRGILQVEIFCIFISHGAICAILDKSRNISFIHNSLHFYEKVEFLNFLSDLIFLMAPSKCQLWLFVIGLNFSASLFCFRRNILDDGWRRQWRWQM